LLLLLLLLLSLSALIVFVPGVQRRSTLEKSGCSGWGKGTGSIITSSSPVIPFGTDPEGFLTLISPFIYITSMLTGLCSDFDIRC